MAPKTRATVQQAYFEYSAVYREPRFDVIALNTKVKSALARALREWGVTPANFTARQNPANDSEVQLNVSLMGGHIVFKAGFGACGVVHTRPTWQDVELVSRIAAAGVGAVTGAMEAVVGKHEAVIAMHITPASGSLRETTAPLVRIPAAGLPAGEVRCFGVSAYGKDSTWTVDASVIHQNALFIRLWHSFPPDTDFETIGHSLSEDEQRVLDLLSLEVE